MISKLLIAILAISVSAAGAASAGQLSDSTAPSYGGNREVISPNALPSGFSIGAVQGQRAQELAGLYDPQTVHAYTDNQVVRPHE